MILLEYWCRSCNAVQESYEERQAIRPTIPCPCGELAERGLSAVKHKTVWATVSRGKYEPPPPGVLSTRHLAREWR